MRRFMKKGLALACVFAMVMTGCGQQGQSNNENEGNVATESAGTVNTVDTTVARGSKVFADATAIVLSDEGVTVDGNAVSADATDAVYVANDIVFYLEGQDFTYGEGEEEDEHSQTEADAHTVVHITKPGTYAVSGTLSAGQIAIDLGDDAKKDPEAVVTLILNGLRSLDMYMAVASPSVSGLVAIITSSISLSAALTSSSFIRISSGPT